MSRPATRADFKEYCLRALGKGAVDIIVSDEQVDDRIDDALRYYWDYHFDGATKTYYKYQITAEDKTNGYITMPENINGVINMFDIGSSIGANNIFNIRYQIALNDLYTLTSVSMVPYYSAMRHIQFLEYLLVGRQPLRYNRHKNKLYIDMDWDRLQTGQYLIVEAYEIVDPDTYTDAWSDRWLLRYGTCLIKEQWGSNLKVYGNMQMPGGITFNGQAIFDEARQEKLALEQEMLLNFSLPVVDMIG